MAIRKSAMQQPHPRCNSAFTLIELLAVIAIILLLLSLLAPALRGARNQAIRTVCRSNIKQLTACWTLHASAHDGRMRIDLNQGGRWLWDVDTATINEFINDLGVVRKSFYCPGEPNQNDDKYWNFNSAYKVIGYWCVVLRADADFQPYGGWPGMIYTNEDEYVSSLSGRLPAGRAVFADATLSTPAGNFVNVVGRYSPGHMSPHLEDALMPAGQNVGFLDGHVAWKNIGDVKSRLAKDPLHYW